MQTHFTEAQLADPLIREGDAILRKCVHCGFCTATCPTFVITGDERDSPISLECGLQNGTLAVVVATQLFNDIVYMVPTAAYALVMFTTSIFFVLIVRKIN